MNANERLLTPDEVAELLALSPTTVVGMLRAGTLPGQKIGGRLWRTRAADLDDFIRLGSEAWAEKRAEKRRTGSRAAVGQPPRHEPLPPRGSPEWAAAAKKPPGKPGRPRKPKPAAPVADATAPAPKPPPAPALVPGSAAWAAARKSARRAEDERRAPAPAAEPPAEPDEDAPPTAADRAALMSIGVSEEDNPLTPEYRKWIAEQAAAAPTADPDDEGGTP